jgi:predicted HAD superfamily Cof-like phosphohydrolase
MFLFPEMTPHERRVTEFMIGARQEVRPSAGIPDDATLLLRSRLKLEEDFEFCRGAGVKVGVRQADGSVDYVDAVTFFRSLAFVRDPDQKPDMEEMIDALADSSVVNTGSFAALGVRMDPILEAVDANNLMKIANGKLDDHGKLIKAPNHPKVNLKLALKLQGYTDPEAPK